MTDTRLRDFCFAQLDKWIAHLNAQFTTQLEIFAIWQKAGFPFEEIITTHADPLFTRDELDLLYFEQDPEDPLTVREAGVCEIVNRKLAAKKQGNRLTVTSASMDGRSVKLSDARDVIVATIIIRESV